MRNRNPTVPGAGPASPSFTPTTPTAHWSHAARGRMERDYEYDDEPINERESIDRYAAAYSSVPVKRRCARGYDAPIRHRSMKSRRQICSCAILLLGGVVILAFTVSIR